MTREELHQTLTELGSTRREAVAVQKAADAKIRPLLRAALKNRIVLQEIRDLTGISISTIRLWAAEAALDDQAAA